MDNLDSPLPPQKTLFNRALIAGLLTAAATSLLGLLVYVFGLNQLLMKNPALNWLNNLISLGIMFYFVHTAIRMFRDQDNSGYLTVGQGIGLGTLAGLIAGVVSGIWAYIFMSYIAPDLIESIRQVTMEQMQKNGQSEEQIDKAMEVASMFLSPGFIALMIPFFSLFLGFLSGVVSGLMQKKDRSFA